jgi:DNA-binding IclR family transcriptional regulator
MSSLDRMLGILDLFDEKQPVWTVEQAMKRTGFSRSTIYRYFKSLNRAGLLAPANAGAYVLGPAIIELDRQIRGCDPLLSAAGPIAEELARASGESVVIAQPYRDKVLCIHLEHGRNDPPGDFSRGRPLPLFGGASSKAIVAHLAPRRLKKLYKEHEGELARYGLSSDWPGFRRDMRAIRRAGVCVTRNEVARQTIGVAAPVLDSEQGIMASIGIVMADRSGANERIAPLSEMVREAARRVGQTLAHIANQAAREQAADTADAQGGWRTAQQPAPKSSTATTASSGRTPYR